MQDGGPSGSLCAVVVTFNSRELIEGCLRALLAQTPRPRIIVVDNASTDGTVEAIQWSFRDTVEVITLKQNAGFAGGCNRGFQAAGPACNWFVCMNPDVLVQPGCLAACVRALSENREVGCVAPLLVRPDGRTVDSLGQVLKSWTLEVRDRGYGQPVSVVATEKQQVLAACGALAMFRRSALEELESEAHGPWVQDYFCFWEDLEIGWHLSNRGWMVMALPEAKAHHERGAGAEAGLGPLRWRRSPALEACIITNRWMTLVRHLHVLDLLRRLPVLLAWDAFAVAVGIIRRPVLLVHIARRIPLVMRQTGMRRRLRRRRLGELMC